MKPLRILGLSLLLAAIGPGASAGVLCGQACEGLVREAHALEGQGKYQEALDKYKAASQAEPQASLPLSSAAALLLSLSTRVKPEQSAHLREMARSMATRAARLMPDDPVAQETLRLLDDDGPSPLHVPTPQAAALQAEADAQYAQRHFKEALEKYQAAILADPQYSVPWVDAGDCYFVQKDWPQAEAMFRRATEIEPRNAQAWRFLSDALLYEGKRDAAGAALVSAIGADPSQRPSWTKLAALRAHEGQPLTPLALRRGVRVLQGADGKYTVQLDSPSANQTETPDLAFRMALGMAEAKLRNDDKARVTPPFEIALGSWRMALKIAGELKANTGRDLGDPALLKMQALARDGQLEPAILLLQFRQSYRPALEAWTAAHPDGIKAFIDRYRLEP